MPRRPIINGPADRVRLERDRARKRQREFNALAYFYMKECESKSVRELYDDHEFHYNAYWGRPPHTPEDIALRHKTIYEIAITIAKVRTGMWPIERLLSMDELWNARVYCRIKDPEFFRRYKPVPFEMRQPLK